MTHQELFTVCAEAGAMPTVKSAVSIKYASSNVGLVTSIKRNGVGVSFPGLNYESWFWAAIDETDKRKKYMHQLEIIKQ